VAGPPADQTPTLIPLGFKDGSFRLRISGPVGRDYLIQASSNLTTWQNLQTNWPAALPFDFEDPVGQLSATRFYRVHIGP
jgi:hypothetical protein